MSHKELKDDDDIVRSLKAKYTPEELQRLTAWYNAFDDNSLLDDSGKEKVEQQVWDRLQDSIHPEDPAEHSDEAPSSWVSRNWYWPLAASVLLLCGLMLWQSKDTAPEMGIAALPAVSPQEKNLWESLTNQDKDIKEVNLPDGSKVWLNPGTSILYKIVKNAPTREVYLEGEAFFDVKPNKQQPFYVKNKGLNVVVLGTSFNVVASAKTDKYEVSVVTGKVKVKYQDPENSTRFNQVIITPQQQVVIQKEENTLETHDFTVEQKQYKQLWEPISISFDEATLDKVLSKLEQEYGVVMRTPNASIRKCTLFANFNNQRLPVIMDILCSSINASYQIEGNEITIIGEGCQ